MHHNEESEVCLTVFSTNKPPSIRDVLRKAMRGLHTRSCAALISAATLMSLSLSGPASTPAVAQQQQQQKPNILFIMGDDIGLYAAEHLPPRPDGRRDAQHRSHRQRRCDLHALLRRAELHGRAYGLHHRHAAGPRRHDLAGNSRQPILSAARHAVACQVPARSRLQHRRVRQEPPGRPRRLAADRARLPGILGLPLSPRCDAGGELPRHQQDPDPADPRAAMQEHADPRSCPRFPARWIPRPRSA